MCLDLFSVAILEYLRLCKEKSFILAYAYGGWEVEHWAAASGKDLVLHGGKPEGPVGTQYKGQNNPSLWELTQSC